VGEVNDGENNKRCGEYPLDCGRPLDAFSGSSDDQITAVLRFPIPTLILSTTTATTKGRRSAMGKADGRRNAPDSPIGQLLKHLGMTREDLQRHSSQMREFLTTESIPSPLPEDCPGPAKLGVDGQPPRQPRSRASSHGNASAVPQTPVKSRHGSGLHKQDTMEAIIERQNKLARKEKRGRRDSNAMGPPSPTPQPATLTPGPSTSTSRDAQHESSSQESETQVGCFPCCVRHAPLT
jgi:hypothetical protein